MARYVIRARNQTGWVEFKEPQTLAVALAKARELRDAQFVEITLVNIANGVEITDLELLIDSDTSRS